MLPVAFVRFIETPSLKENSDFQRASINDKTQTYLKYEVTCKLAGIWYYL